jgi:hypothetical protein
VAEPDPDFLQPSQPRVRRWPWHWLAVPALGALLALQIAVADRARWAADPAWRPRIEQLCGWLRCSVPAWREPTAFHITSREIRPHPSAAGVLLVTASFRNDAAFAQDWPRLQLSLSDLNGQSLGLRRFTPREYLGSDPATRRIGPGQSASITLEILDPGKRAVAFSFDFLE